MNSEMRRMLSVVVRFLLTSLSKNSGFLRHGVFILIVAACSAVSSRAAAKSIELPKTCYLFSFFYHQTEGDGLHLAWSRDGFAWEILGADKSYLRPAVGEK